MKIKSKNLKFLGITTLSLPFMLFSIFWFKIFIGVPVLLLVIYSLDAIIRKKLEKDDREYVIKVSYILFAFIFIMIIMMCGGHGEWWSQRLWDWPVRNAVYRDLCTFDWPVVFFDNSFLCYYFGYFLPPAFISKFLAIFIRNAFLYDKVIMQVELLWGTYVVLLSFLLVLDYLHKRCAGFKKYIDKKEILIVLMVFVFFSGLDIIGSVFFTPVGKIRFDWMNNLDVWSYKVFPCFVSNLWDAFTQGIMFYLAAILIFMQEDMTIILYLAGVSFISLIFPLIGLALLCIPLLIKRIKNILELVSIPNIAGIAALIASIIFIISQSGMIDSASSYSFPIQVAGDAISNLKDHIIFLILEFYIYFILLFKKNYQDKVFIMSGLTVYIFIFIEYVKGTWEVFLRCPMPMTFYISILCIKEMIDFYHDKKVEVARVLLIICLIIGAATPICDIARNTCITRDNGWKPLIHDEQHSFSDDRIYTSHLDVASQYKGYNYNDSIFHKTIGR